MPNRWRRSSCCCVIVCLTRRAVNANAAIFGISGSGKSVLAQKILMSAFAQNIKVASVERGDSYSFIVRMFRRADGYLVRPICSGGESV